RHDLVTGVQRALFRSVHRHVDQHRARAARGGGPERAFGEPGQVLGPVYVPGALGERPVDGALVGVGVQVDLLVRMPARVVAGHVDRESVVYGTWIGRV